MSSQNDDSTPKDPTSSSLEPPPEPDTDDEAKSGSSYGYGGTLEPPPEPDTDDGAKSGYGIGSPTRGSYMELHGDPHKGQEPPEEKD